MQRPTTRRSLLGAALAATLVLGACSNDETTYEDEPFSDVSTSVPVADGVNPDAVDGTEDGNSGADDGDLDNDGTENDVPEEVDE